MFGGHWFSGSGDITYLIYHGNSQDQVIEESSDVKCGSSSLYLLSIYLTLTIKLHFWHLEMRLAFHEEWHYLKSMIQIK